MSTSPSETGNGIPATNRLTATRRAKLYRKDQPLDLKTVGSFIRRKREHRKFSQTDMAEYVRTNRITLIRIENGTYGYNMRVVLLMKILKVIGYRLVIEKI